MKERLRIVSHFPGRLRVRARPLRDAILGAQVAEHLRAELGVTAVVPTPLTGSLLVEYEAQTVQLPWLVQLIVQLAGLDGIAADHKGPPQITGPSIREALDRWNGAIVHATRGRIDTRVAIPGTFAGLGLLSLLFGKRQLPMWYDLMFWSFVTFHNLNVAQHAANPVEADGQPT